MLVPVGFMQTSCDSSGKGAGKGGAGKGGAGKGGTGKGSAGKGGTGKGQQRQGHRQGRKGLWFITEPTVAHSEHQEFKVDRRTLSQCRVARNPFQSHPLIGVLEQHGLPGASRRSIMVPRACGDP